jgi:hypothetical protein
MACGILIVMKKMTLYLTDDMHRGLKDAARRTGKSEAQMIRESVAAYLADQPRSYPRSIGIASSGRIPAETAKDWIHAQWDRETASHEPAVGKRTSVADA